MTTPNGSTIFIVEDDQSVRDALGLLLGLRGLPVVMFADAESFLNAYRAEWRGCLLIDIRMPGMDGLTLQKRLLEIGCGIPAIIMTGHGDVESAREAFRSQAVDFLEKPIDQAILLGAVEEAFALQAASQDEEQRLTEFDYLLASLSPREKEVMALVVEGRHNREIAEMLVISARTVEVHKARMMAKLRVKGIPDLVRLNLVSQGKFRSSRA
ncbi:MAG: response regulator transcription factor [Zoogloea sp.]|uniref:response regulator transcription factor n=1 Tax=Zoogloea sp. TaxID=49181 RepID=UPI003F31BAC8